MCGENTWGAFGVKSVEFKSSNGKEFKWKEMKGNGWGCKEFKLGPDDCIVGVEQFASVSL